MTAGLYLSVADAYAYAYAYADADADADANDHTARTQRTGAARVEASARQRHRLGGVRRTPDAAPRRAY